MQSEKLRSQDNYDNKVSYGKLMPRRAENFGEQLITEGILELRCDFLRLLPVICCEKCRFSLFRLVFGFFLAKRNKVQTHPHTPPSSLRYFEISQNPIYVNSGAPAALLFVCFV